MKINEFIAVRNNIIEYIKKFEELEDNAMIYIKNIHIDSINEYIITVEYAVYFNKEYKFSDRIDIFFNELLYIRI